MIIGVYIVFLVFSKYYIDFLSENLIRYINGKKIEGSLFGEYSFIRIFTEYDELGINSNFLHNIITNLLGYDLLEYKYITYKNTKHKVLCYTKSDSIGIKKSLQHLLLINLECVDTKYLDEFEENVDDELRLINIDALEYEKEYLEENVFISYDGGFSSYDGFFIYQFSENGDEIQENIYTEVYRSLESFYPNDECNGILLNYNENNIETPELFRTYTDLTEKYILQKYCMLSDKIINYFEGLFEIKYSKIILSIFATALLIYAIFGILRDYLDSATISLFLTFPAAIYYSWNLYEKYQQSKK